MSTRRDSALEVIKDGSLERWIADNFKDEELANAITVTKENAVAFAETIPHADELLLSRILILMDPFIPHFTSERLVSINQNKTTWPIVALEDLVEDEINLVVQINGKKRAILRVKRDMNEKEILKATKINQDIEKFLTKQNIKKIIFVPNRLINIII